MITEGAEAAAAPGHGQVLEVALGTKKMSFSMNLSRRTIGCRGGNRNGMGWGKKKQKL